MKQILRRLQRRFGRWWWRARNGDTVTEFSIPHGGVKPRHLGIILPLEFADFDIARHSIEPLLLRLRPERTTLMVRNNFRTWLSADAGASVMTFDARDRDWLGFPKRNAMVWAKQLELDMVIDLTPTYSPYTAALAAATVAPMRISFDCEHRSGFYNLLIRLNPEIPLPERYTALMRYV